MVYPRHIPLSERKALCGRLIFLDAVNLVGVAPPKNVSAYNTFTSFLLLHLNMLTLTDKTQRDAEARAPIPAKPLKALDLSLSDAINSFKKTPSYQLVTGDLHSKTLMRMVTASVNAVSCLKCSPNGPVCEGLAQMKDDGIVHLKGACISQLREMFEVARDAAQCYYATYASGFPSNPVPDIVLSTGMTSSVPESEHRLPHFHAGAVTKFIDEPGQARAETKLKLIVDNQGFLLDLYTYKGILYVMFHECISHAFHGLIPSFQDRKVSGPFDSFSEGFMDQVAYEIFTEAVNEKGLAKSLELKGRIVLSDILGAAEKMHFERNECEFDEIATNKASIALGVKAAVTSQYLIQKAYTSDEFGPAEDFRSAFYRLAFDLNMKSDIERDARRDFVSLMYEYYLLSKIKFENRDHEANLRLLDIEQVIVKYLRTGQLSELVLDAQRLCLP